jgi:hypothetical protein
VNILGILGLFVLALFAGSEGSVPTFNVGHPPPRYRLVIKDNPTLARFDLTLRSLDRRTICLGGGGWPSPNGNVDWGSQWVKLQSNSDFLPARDWNFGICFGDCSIHVAPHGKLSGFIGYAEFGDPKKITALPNRKLHFDPIVYVCK